MHRTGTSLYTQVPKSESGHIASLLPTGLPTGQVWWTTASGQVPGNPFTSSFWGALSQSVKHTYGTLD